MDIALVAVAVLALAALAVAGGALARRPVPVDEALREEVRAQAVRLDRIADGLHREALDQDNVRDQLHHARSLLGEMRARDDERRDRDEEARRALHRLEATFLGAASRGRVGENVVWEALSMLPPDMVDTGFRVNGKLVEFSLRLPDGRRLPVDSKWSALAEVEALASAEGADRARLAQAVERVVAERAREVAKYLDPSLTTPFAVAAVPDAAHAVLRKAHLDAFQAGVLLVPYSTALPVLLALYALCCRLGGSDGVDVGGLLTEVGSSLDGIERVLENHVERAGKMAQNAAVEIRTHLGRARGALGKARPVGPEEVTPLRVVE
jgi:DNA recombination protein RmuC